MNIKIKTMLLLFTWLVPANASAQTVITFNDPWLYDTVRSYNEYTESGLRFNVAAVSPNLAYHYMTRYGAAIGSHAANGTPHMEFERYDNRTDYVLFSQNGGGAFGVKSVDLADTFAPSPAPIAISFIGQKSGGQTVTNTFNTPGGGLIPFKNTTSALILPQIYCKSPFLLSNGPWTTLLSCPSPEPLA